MMLFTIVGKYEAVVKSLNIARRALEEQAQEIEILQDKLKIAEIALKVEQDKLRSPKPDVKLYRFPNLTPGV